MADHGLGLLCRSLTVHPSLPYLLSSSDDMLIKLWDWDKVSYRIAMHGQQGSKFLNKLKATANQRRH